MLPAANQPILAHVLDALVEAGIQKICLVVGYKRERVQEHFGAEYRDIPIEYVIQDKQLGSGHALAQARSAVDGSFVVVNGDQLTDRESISRVTDRFAETDDAVMAVVDRPQAGRYGVVTLEGNQVTELDEKPDTDEYGLINAGIYAFTPTIFESIDETPRRQGELVLTDAITRHIEADSIQGVHVDGLWADATYPWDLLEVASEVLERGRATEPDRSDGIWIDSDASVHESATLQPPVVIGPDCEIGPSTVVGPDVALAQNTTLGANVTVHRAVIDSDCRVGHGSTLVDAVLGQEVHLGVDTTIQGGPGDVRVDNRVFESQPLGAVLADRVSAGGNVSFESGTLVGTGATLSTGVTVDTNVGTNAEVIR
jgi:glucose-1-phosphate thymidylyltransferase